MGIKCFFGLHKYVPDNKTIAGRVHDVGRCAVCGNEKDRGPNARLTHELRLRDAKEVTRRMFSNAVIKSPTPTKKPAPKRDHHRSASTYESPRNHYTSEYFTGIIIHDNNVSSSSDWSGGGGSFSGGGASGSWDSGGCSDSGSGGSDGGSCGGGGD